MIRRCPATNGRCHWGLGITKTTTFNGRPMNIGPQYFGNVERPARSAGYQLQFAISLLYPEKK
jgi:hypothetical protein